MRMSIRVAILGLFISASAGIALAALIVDGEITNKATFDTASNASIGENSKARMGSVEME